MSAHSLAPNEKDTVLLAAYTPDRYPGNYPSYINFTMVRRNGAVVLTVRHPTVHGGPMGESASVRLADRDQWREFVKLVEEANKKWEACDYLDSVM